MSDRQPIHYHNGVPLPPVSRESGLAAVARHEADVQFMRTRMREIEKEKKAEKKKRRKAEDKEFRDWIGSQSTEGIMKYLESYSVSKYLCFVFVFCFFINSSFC